MHVCVRERERENVGKRKNIEVKEYAESGEELTEADTRILDRSLDKQKLFDAWLWRNVAQASGSMEVEKVVYGSAGDLKMSAVTTRRYLLERVLKTDPYYTIFNGQVIWRGFQVSEKA